MAKLGLSIPVLLILLTITIFLSASFGAMEINWNEIFIIFKNKFNGLSESSLSQKEAVLFNIRLPRIIMSLFVGGSLAICGTALQGLFRNPLADPSVIGISMGAALSAGAVIVFSSSLLLSTFSLGGMTLLSISTFLGAVATTFFIFGISKQGKKVNIVTMLLAGIAINALAGAGLGLLSYLADDAQLRTLTFWTLGSMGGASWNSVLILGISCALTIIFLLPQSKAFNALALGEQEAAIIGVSTEQLKIKVIVLTALAVGASVAFCGMIGFVGLVTPHILRIIGGSDHRFLLPVSAIVGGLLLVWADNFSRLAVAPAEIPIGIVTALIGAPVFLYLLLKQRRYNL